jgi:hypothetical protein
MGSYVTNPQVIHETIEGETIIIDLSSGTYFSLRGSAPAIWNALAEGATEESIVQRLEGLYDAELGELEAAVKAFLAELETERLIAPGASNGSPAAAAEAPSSRSPFEPPRLERFEDMQDIILLDPVHNVDDRGWPHAAPVGGEST